MNPLLACHFLQGFCTPKS